MAENPTLTAEITTGETPELHVTVANGDGTIEESTADLALLIQNNQYVSSFERPVLSLLSLYEREVAAEQVGEQPTEEIGNGEIQDLPTQE